MQEVVREILKRAPAPPHRRATHGEWVTPAWVVKGLVEKNGWNVSDAVRHTISELKLLDSAFDGIRAAYYSLREKPWPEN